MKKYYKTIGLMFLVGILVMAGIFFHKGPEADEPNSLIVTVYSVALMADNSSSPVTIFSDPNGVQADLVHGLSQFGQGSVPAGTYKRVKLVLKNQFSWTGINPCDNKSSIDNTSLIDDSLGPDAQVEVYFATSEDGGGSGWTNDGTEQAPFLMQSPIVVEPSGTTILRFVFNINDTLRTEWQGQNCNYNLLPPALTAVHYVEEPPACDISGKYWFVHYNISTDPYHDNGTKIDPDNMTQVFEKTAVIAGWGVATFNSDGTIIADTSKPYEDEGMAEHRHNLNAWDINDTTDEGFINPIGGDNATGEYVMSGNRIFIFMPGGTVIEGAVTDDCSTFVGAHVAQTRESDMIYAVKMPQSAPTLTGKYIMISPRFYLQYDNTSTNPYPIKFVGSRGGITVFDADAQQGSPTMVEWLTYISFNPDLLNNSWTTIGPTEAVDNSTTPINSIVTVNDNGTLTLTGEPFFGALTTTGNGILAGYPAEYESDNATHPVYAGYILKLAPNPSLTDLEGRWFLSLMSYDVSDGYNNGNEAFYYNLNFGDVTISSCGAQSCSASWTFTRKEIFNGQTFQQSGTGTVEKTTECLAPGTPITDPNCTDGITIPVFYVKENGQIVAKLALDSTKKVLGIWTKIDQNDIPEDNTSGGGAPNVLTGAAVKIQ